MGKHAKPYVQESIDLIELKQFIERDLGVATDIEDAKYYLRALTAVEIVLDFLAGK
jgi:hypothetical protein